VNALNCKIKKEGYELEIPYYELENTCENITKNYLEDKSVSLEERLLRQKDFLEFSKEYQTFTPYFDYVFQKLGYCLINPFLISDTTMWYHDGYYYAVCNDEQNFSIGERKMLSKPIFMERKEKYIKRQRIPKNYENIEECFIDKDGNMVSLDSSVELHNFWATMWIHDLLMKDKKICKSYQKRLKDEVLMVYDQAELFIQYMQMMQCSIILESRGSSVVMRYNSSSLSSVQKEILEQMKSIGLLKDIYSLDMFLYDEGRKM